MQNHHPDCPHSVLSDTIIIRNSMYPCQYCDIAEKVEQRVIHDLTSGTRIERLMWEKGVLAAYGEVEKVRDRFPAPNGVIFASHALEAIKGLING